MEHSSFVLVALGYVNCKYLFIYWEINLSQKLTEMYYFDYIKVYYIRSHDSTKGS